MLKIKILGAYGGSEKNKGLTSFLIDDNILIDAGNVVSTLSIEDQKNIDHIIVSHSHLDHIKDIPLLADNFVEIPEKKVKVYGLGDTINSLKNNFFNNIIFPDFAMIPVNNPIIEYKIIEEKKQFLINDISILPIKVNHTVPNLAFIVEKNESAFVFISDTFETDEIFNQINKNNKIKFVIIETSFPNNMEELAVISKHLTPKLMKKEIDKIDNNNIKIFIYHIKPKYYSQIISEVKSIQSNKSINFLEDGMVFEI